ncbi:MAG: RidA family protein [Phycisphaerales bacterium JB043]
MSKSVEVMSDRAPLAVGAYPHARRVGDLLFLSGIGPRKKGTSEIPGVTLDGNGRVLEYDIEAQCLSVFENLRFVLEDAGSSWESMVDVLVFLTNMERDFGAFNALYKEHFGMVRPARTTIEVGALPTPIAIELKVVATI